MFRNNYFVRPSLTTGTLFVLFFVSVVLFISKQVAAQGTSTDATPRTGGEYSADTIPAQETLPERMPRFGDDVQPVDGFTRSATGTERAANRSAAR